MSDHIYKSHNKTVLLYHLVFPAKYRRKVFSKEVEKTLVKVCEEISERFEINFVEIGNDTDHVHFLVQGVPKMPVSRIVQIIKSITAREIFAKHKEIKKMLWGGNLWTSGFYANTVGQYGNEDMIRTYVKNQAGYRGTIEVSLANMIRTYVKNQGKEYKKVYTGQLKFDL